MTQEDLQKIALLYTEWNEIRVGRLSGDEDSLSAARIAFTVMEKIPDLMEEVLKLREETNYNGY
tara:strand:- start:793 stop:984 length:192 start_codon:yes stop_codon:yes gene_type:complete